MYAFSIEESSSYIRYDCDTKSKLCSLDPLFNFCIFIVVVMLQQMDLTLYDPKGSHTSELISCDHEFCSSTYDGPIPGCKAETPCPYSITYGDGSATTGYYVRDYLTFDRINGNLHTAPQNSSIIFG